ncbi:hypothetical protein [Actinacidiphila glaucinigra]|uniref:hypothetical protein n=1 Tax=Actinacidiphila glaucinigra TaxID=235986 RepID=UPI002E345318|nr:hypothetical protein [Actinacidiphila glaucinigra]
MLSAPALGTVFGVPLSLALCAAAVLVAMLVLVAVVALCTLRRVEQADLPAALLGLAHVISALCGLLPWGKPVPPPGLPSAPTVDAPPEGVPTVVLVQGETAEGTIARRGEL